ncbi:hypothetical protein B0H19DRAFT_1255710 [Mycena capillaripes]|nr:hypothetical protein B0H19DRAFT_1255710 [Mycena capillaripes]
MTSQTFITAVLGTPDGSSDHLQVNLWFLVDFLFAAHLLGDETPQAKQRWLTQIDVYEKLKELQSSRPTSTNLALHGPRYSERFQLPIPSSSDDYFFHQHSPGQVMKIVFLDSIKMQAVRMQASDHLIILLFGHGQEHEEVDLRGRVECGVDSRGNTVWLQKTEVERAVRKSRGRISLISTACFASAWRSNSWGLFAAAQDGESLGLPPSESNRSWGSSFLASIPEMAATSLDCTFHPLAYPMDDPTNTHLLLLSSSLTPKTLSHLTFGSEAPRIAIEEHELAPSDVAEAFRMLCGAMHGNHTQTDHNFTPSIPSHMKWSGWQAFLGLKSSLDVVLKTHGLQRQPPNPSEWELSTGGGLGTEDEARRASVSSGESESESESESDSDSELEPNLELTESEPSLEYDELEIIDRAGLDDMVSHWCSRTRPLELTTAARQSLGILVSRYQAGNSNSDECRALFRLFHTRMAADQRAQQLVEELGFVNQSISCMDFREVDSIPPCHGISFHSVHWGELAPKDDIFVDRLQHRYRKAGQWVFHCWAKSGKEVEALEELVGRVGGRLT